MKRFVWMLALVLSLAVTAVALGAPRTAASQDRKAKSNARNMVSQVESCFTETMDYSKCRHPTGTGLPIGSHRGQVQVTHATKLTYTVDGFSRSGVHWLLVKRSNGTVARRCTPRATATCPASGRW